MAGRFAIDSTKPHLLPLNCDRGLQFPPFRSSAIKSWHHLPAEQPERPSAKSSIPDLTHIRLNSDPFECERIPIDGHGALTKRLAECILCAPNLRVRLLINFAASFKILFSSSSLGARPRSCLALQQRSPNVPPRAHGCHRRRWNQSAMQEHVQQRRCQIVQCRHLQRHLAGLRVSERSDHRC
jgi:hypothetical protein